GYVKQGTHPVVWCPHCESPTGDHDRLEGEGESPIEYVMIKFEFVDELSGKTFFIPCATLRPETIYGVTNIWVNPNTEYVIAIVEKGYTGADVGGEVWIISKECAEKIRAQLYDVQEIGRVHASQLVGKRVVEPMNKKEIPILPADFVDPQNATGIVMSVPSHAPYDWIAIKELTDSGLEKYGVNKDDMEPISLIETEGFGKHPAIEVCKTLGITSQKQTAKLDEATSMIYKKEFHQGILKNNCGEYAGKKVSEVKLHLTNDFIRKKIAALMWETTERVVCRCTTLCHVKILEDQWFLTYSDKEWKTRVLEHLAEMKIYPEEARSQFENTIDWLKDKACARKTGLGTKLPWDKEWIVETLSDSTIYMAYYTVAHIINEHNITAEQLTKEVFDFVFRGIGSAKGVVKKSGISEKILNQMKKEFEYFYPVDMRSSGKDLVQHHLLFYLFHHVAIFEKNKWPVAVAVNGYVNVEGEKMSKSKGNFLPLRDLVQQFGADIVRVNIVSAAEGMDDADWRAENVGSLINRLNFFYELANDLKKARVYAKSRLIDKWLEAEIHKTIKDVSVAYDEMKLRTVTQRVVFDSMNALKWYIKRNGNVSYANKKILEQCLTNIIKLLTPIAPHICEEIWEKLGNKDFASLSEWPKHNDKIIVVSEDVERTENFIKKIIEDVNGIKKIVKKQPKKIVMFVAKTASFGDKNGKKEQMEIRGYY
ncbi:leucine--tRNA ligase, partial [Candidatus Woesearchaeota archaeon]|nr:leucine--tRNA ligase [Candidatus Woesearchaeota archaeon]